MDLNSIPVFEKSQQQMNEIVPLLKNNFLTKNLQSEEIEKIAKAMKPEVFQPGATIIKYGDFGQLYYILSKGQVKVMIYETGADPNDPHLEKKIKVEKVLEEGTGFGELALLYNDKRSATIEALTTCETYVLDGGLFKQIIVNTSIQSREKKAGFLDQIKLFDSLDKFQKLRLIDGLKYTTLNKNDFVIREGEDGHEFYIIDQGEVQCLKLHSMGSKTGFVHVRKLAAGEHFGELALINHEKRSLSVRVSSDSCRLLKLDSETFTRILGQIQDKLKKDYDHEFDAKMLGSTPTLITEDSGKRQLESNPEEKKQE